MPSLSGLADIPLKTGEIFRNSEGQYSFMCFNCGLIFEDFGEIIGHCETHYGDVKYNISELVLCPETDTEQLQNLSPPATETTEPTTVTIESTKLAKTSQVCVRRRKKSKSTPLPDFPQYCPICGVWCDKFKEHIKTEHNYRGKIYQCFICKKCFHVQTVLKQHMTSKFHTASTCYHCAMDPPITNPTEPRRHKCLFCKEWYANHAEFKVHFHVAHDKDADTFFARRKNCNIFTCYVCEKEFPLRYYLTSHMKIHYDKFLQHTCPTCGRRLRTFGQLTQHLKTHEGKVYDCDQCGKQFSHYVRLRLHKKVHVTELNFKCAHCPKVN